MQVLVNSGVNVYQAKNTERVGEYEKPARETHSRKQSSRGKRQSVRKEVTVDRLYRQQKKLQAKKYNAD